MTIAVERTILDPRPPSALGLHLGDEELRSDPYPTWDWLRTNDPVHRTAHRSFLLTRYEDCAAALRDRRLSSDMRNATADVYTEESDVIGSVTFRPSLFYEVPDGAPSRPFIFRDPPEHDRLRRAALPAFRPLAMRNLASRVDEVASSLVDDAIARERFDAVADIAYPLPVTIICDLLGIPDDARALIHVSAGDVGALIDAGDVRTRAERERTRSGLMNAITTMAILIAARQTEPADDLVSHLVAEGLSPEDMIATVTLLLVAGHETTVNLIANATLALLTHPDELDRLVADQELIPDAIEEFIRYDAPVQIVARVAIEDMELHGKRIAAGDQVLVCIGAANRDPERFDDAHVLDVTRPEAKHHLGFGAALHYCLGAPLARMEATAVLRRLVPHLRHYRIAEAPTWRPVSSLRSLSALHLRAEGP